MDELTLLKSMVRIGTVRATDEIKNKARVWYDAMGMMSGWLYVTKRGEPWMPQIDDCVLVLCIPVLNGDGFILGGI
ncbi:MAG: phage baseplate assembly protein V [Oscillospiraceae bacterium]|nr:phage baseplate assembly protein V [Oscillospiraceae bacterium]